MYSFLCATFIYRKMSSPGLGIKWACIAFVVYVTVIVIKHAQHLFFFSDIYSDQALPTVDRQVDISDSRLSNFGSDSVPHLDSSEPLAVDRVIPLTSTLNRVMNKICRKFSLYVQLEDKKILSLRNNLNFTFSEVHSGVVVEKNVYGMDAMVSRLDSLQRLDEVYISENSDSEIVLIQKLRFQILKYKHDYYDEDLNLIARSSFSFPNNTFLLNISMSTNVGQTNCKVSSVALTFVPDTKSCVLKLDRIVGSKEFYAKLELVLYQEFNTKVITAIKKEIFPLLTKIIHQSSLCSYFGFDANAQTSLDSRDFLSAYVYDN